MWRDDNQWKPAQCTDLVPVTHWVAFREQTIVINGLRARGFIWLGFKLHVKVQLLTLLTHLNTNRKCTDTSAWIQWRSKRPSDTEWGGVCRKVGSLSVTHTGRINFKSLHHLHWFPFLRSGGFTDLHSYDVKREKWNRKSRTRASAGAPSSLLFLPYSLFITCHSGPSIGCEGLLEAKLCLVSSNPWPSAEQVQARTFNKRLCRYNPH